MIVREQGCPVRLKFTWEAWKPELSQSWCVPRRLQTILLCRVGRRHWHCPTNSHLMALWHGGASRETAAIAATLLTG